jgi:hypothetical protein
MASDRFVKLYVTGYDYSHFQCISDNMRHCGYSITFPGTSDIYCCRDDGIRFVLGADEFKRHYNVFPKIVFQWWRNECNDIVCSIRRLVDATGIYFSTDGVDKEHEDKFIQCAIGISMQMAKKQMFLGLVVDRTGDWSEVDWDIFFLEKRILVGHLPAILGVKYDHSKILSKQFPSASRQECSGFVIIRQ